MLPRGAPPCAAAIRLSPYGGEIAIALFGRLEEEEKKTGGEQLSDGRARVCVLRVSGRDLLCVPLSYWSQSRMVETGESDAEKWLVITPAGRTAEDGAGNG